MRLEKEDSELEVISVRLFRLRRAVWR